MDLLILLHKPRAILFDVDGTLYSQQCLRARLLARHAGYLALHPRSSWEAAQAVSAFRRALEIVRLEDAAGGIPDCQFQLAADLAGIPEIRLRNHIQRWFVEAPLPLLRSCVRSGLTELLEFARGHGILLATFSDYAGEDKLRALGIREFFQVVASAEDTDIQSYKPNPLGLQVTLARLGVEPPDAIYVGDRPEVDAAAASGAGMGAVIVGHSPRSPGSEWLSVWDYLQLKEHLVVGAWASPLL